MKRSLFVAFTILSLLTHVFGQTAEEMTNARQSEQAAVKSYEAKAYPDYLKNILLANNSRPNHPRLIYNLASAYAVNGQDVQAMDELERLGKMGLYFAIEKDDDFKALLASDRFKSIQAKLAENRNPVNASSMAFTVADKTLIGEGIAYNAKTRTFYLGSVHQRKIVAIDKNGAATDFSQPGDGLWSVLGMKVDQSRGWLYVCSAAFPQMRGFISADKGRSGIFKYDLRTGKLSKKYILPDGNHALGDLELARDGSVYATDSVSPVVHKIDVKRDKIEEFVRSENFASLQGLAFSGGDKHLYVADYSKGIFRIDTATKQIVQLKAADSITLLGIDGMYFYRGKLLAIQNGVNPHRVICLTISSINSDRITAFKTLEANHPDFMEPTLGTLIGHELYYVANSQWPLVNEKAELNLEKLRPPVILKLDANKALAK